MNTTEQNNILIAEFLGMQKTDLGWFDNEEVFLDIERDNTFDNLKFHYDWNWLMLVVKKIESIEDSEFDVNISRDYCKIDSCENTTFKNIINTNGDTIQCTYNTCVQFVNWYNENLTSQN